MKTNIKKYRELRGLTQEELAREVGVSRCSICKYEQGYANPPFYALQRISKTLMVSINRLCGEETVSETESNAVLDYKAEYERLRSAHNDIVQDNMALHEENKALKRHLDILEKQLEIVKLIFGGNENV